ncbi:MAG: CPBP family glutamic-type intramembrane protease [Asticcacaulis sp.]
MARFELYSAPQTGQRRTWAWLTLPLAWAFIFYGNGVADRIAMLFGQHASAANAVWQHNVLAQFGSLVILGFLVLWLRLWERRTLGDVGLGWPLWGRFGRGFVVGLIMVALVVAAGLVLGVMTIAWPGAWYDHLTPVWLLAASLAIIGTCIQASTSEILFRGWIMSAFAARWSGFLGVAASVLMFTYMQGVDPRQSPESTVCVVNIALMTWFFSLRAMKDGTLWGVCGLHAAWTLSMGLGFGMNIDGRHLNITPLFLSVASTDGAPEWLSGGSFGPDGSVLMTLVAGAAVLWRLWRDRRSRPVNHAGYDNDDVEWSYAEE